MQKLAEICIQRPVFAMMLIASLMVVGITGYVNLGVDRFPSVDLPTVSVRTSLPGAASEEVETEVTERIEEAVNTIEGIDELRSITGPGSSIVIITFNLDRDIESAAQDVRDRLARVQRDLPEDVLSPTVSKFDNDSSPVLTLALYGPRSTRELTELADKIVKEQLERSDGVGEVAITGGLLRTMNIWIDADKLTAYGLSVTEVREAVARQNLDVPGGNVTGPYIESVVRTIGKLPDQESFNNLIVKYVDGSPIRLKDIGYAQDGQEERRSGSLLNGQPAVTISVRRQSGSNTVAVIESVKKKLDDIKAQLPADVQIQIIRDQSNYIYAALHEIDFHLVMGSILACSVVLIFMRNWRSTFIAGIAIPTSLVATFGVMWALDFTLNGVTMLALVLMIGIVIDDAIVVLENIFRFIEEKKLSPREAAAKATAEIGLAVMATTLSLVVIFVPVSFMSSVSGRFLYQFGMTAAAAVLVSLLVSFTLTPMMSARFLRVSDVGGEAAGHGATGLDNKAHDNASSRRGFYRYIDGSYAWALRWSMRHRITVSVVAVLVIASAWPLYGMVKQEYVPGNVDEAEFEVRVTGPESASTFAMEPVMVQIDKDIRDMPQVRLVQDSFGGGFLGGVNEARYHVGIAPHEERLFSLTRLFKETLHLTPWKSWQDNYSQRDVMNQIRKKLSKYPNVRASVRNYPSFNIGGGNFDVDFVFRGPELEKLAGFAEELRERSVAIGGFNDLDTTLKLTKAELRVNIDRTKAADLGIDPADIGTAIRLLVGGDQEVTRFRDPTQAEDYDVRLRLTENYRNDPELLSSLYLKSDDGNLVQLGDLASITQTMSPARIDRLNRQRSVNLRGGIADGYAQSDRIAALRAEADKMNLPAGYVTSISGKGRELERTFYQFLWAFLLSVILMYMILAAQFESLTHPLTILISLPLSVPFALLSLWGTGNTLNLYSALGILVLFGVVKKNAILQIDHTNQLRQAGYSRYDAIMSGNRDRLRPILMTTFSLVAGMLPLAVGTGPGAEERRTIAVVIIGGQTLSLILTLIVTPVVYSLLDDVSSWLARCTGNAAANADSSSCASNGMLDNAAVHVSPAASAAGETTTLIGKDKH